MADMPSIGGTGRALTAQDVLDYAQQVSESGTDVGVNMCQRFVRMAFGSAGGAATAFAAWQQNPDKHTKGTPPPGAAVYWGGGAGHVAISAGNGMVYSTDAREPGKVSLVPMDFITNQWGKPLLGWSGQNNERKILKFNAKPVEGVGGSKYDPVYAGNGSTAGGQDATAISEKELRQRYGYAAEVYGKVPEIMRLVKMGEKAKWTPDEFQHRVEASKWYKNHTDAERKYVLESTAQPAEAAKTIKDKRADVVNMYRNMGITVAPDRVDQIAKAAVVHGWSPQTLQNALAAEFDYKPDKTFGGVAGQTIDQFRQQSAAYLVPLSNDTLDNWTQMVLRGDATPDSYTAYLKTQAKSLFPEIAPSIDAGQTVADYLSPYKEMAAQQLEVNPSTIDWMNPKWSQAVFQTDPKTNERRIMGLADWQKTLRTDPTYGYDKTTAAVDAASTFATQLAQKFGSQ